MSSYNVTLHIGGGETKLTIKSMLQEISKKVFHVTLDESRFDSYRRLSNTNGPESFYTRYLDIFCRTLPDIYKSLRDQPQHKLANSKVSYDDKIFSNWIEAFEATEVKHTVSDLNRTYIDSINQIILAYSCSSRAFSAIHGSFAIYLLNPSVSYHDIDIMSNNDYRLLVTIVMLFYFIKDVNIKISAIPMIVNHRRIFLQELPKETLMDVMHIDDYLIAILKQRDCFREVNGFHIIHPVIIFMNYFKMLPLEDRRNRLAQSKTNEKLKLGTLWNYLVNVNKISTEETLTVECKIHHKIIYLKLNSRLYILYTGIQDKFFLDTLSFKHLDPGLYQRRTYRQYSGILAETFVEIIHENKVIETHVNFSRNEIWIEKPYIKAPLEDISSAIIISVEATQIHYISLVSILATIGIFDFITNKNLTPSIVCTIRNIIAGSSNSGMPHRYAPRTANTGIHLTVDINKSFQSLIPKQIQQETETILFTINQDRSVEFHWN